MAAASSNKETSGAAEVRAVEVSDLAVAEIEFVWQILAIKGIYFTLLDHYPDFVGSLSLE